MPGLVNGRSTSLAVIDSTDKTKGQSSESNLGRSAWGTDPVLTTWPWAYSTVATRQPFREDCQGWEELKGKRKEKYVGSVWTEGSDKGKH